MSIRWWSLIWWKGATIKKTEYFIHYKHKWRVGKAEICDTVRQCGMGWFSFNLIALWGEIKRGENWMLIGLSRAYSICVLQYTKEGADFTPSQTFDACDLSMTQSAPTGSGCLHSRLPASCSGWPRLRTPSLCWEGGNWRSRSTCWTRFWSMTDSEYRSKFIHQMRKRNLWLRVKEFIYFFFFSFIDLSNGASQSHFFTQSMDMQQYPTMILFMWLEERETISEYIVWQNIYIHLWHV